MLVLEKEKISKSTNYTKITFAGSRFKYFKNIQTGCFIIYDLLTNFFLNLTKYVPRDRVIIAHGGNVGSVDILVDYVAREYGFKIFKFRPRSWKDREDLLLRNKELVEWSNIVVTIFVDGKSPGTSHVLNLAKKLNKSYISFFVDTENKKVNVLEHSEDIELIVKDILKDLGKNITTNN